MSKSLIKCDGCGIDVWKENAAINQYKKHYCSDLCCRKSKKAKDKFCLNCGNKCQNYHQVKFCSRSCAAKYHNKERLQNRPETFKQKSRKCIDCNNLTFKRSKYCSNCKHNRRIIAEKEIAALTVGDVMYRGSNRYSYIRATTPDIGKNKPCQCCGWDKHVQICHIKAVASFPKDTLLTVVNHPDNLIVLCPNCHWQFDHDEEFRKNLLEQKQK